MADTALFYWPQISAVSCCINLLSTDFHFFNIFSHVTSPLRALGQLVHSGPQWEMNITLILIKHWHCMPIVFSSISIVLPILIFLFIQCRTGIPVVLVRRGCLAWSFGLTKLCHRDTFTGRMTRDVRHPAAFIRYSLICEMTYCADDWPAYPVNCRWILIQ